MARAVRQYRSADGTIWNVEIRSPGASNVMVVFRHPDGGKSSLDRYNWLNWGGAESQNVTSRLEPARVLGSLSDADLARLFRRAMPVSARGNPLNRAPAA